MPNLAFRNNWITRNLALLLAVVAVLSAIFSYGFLAGSHAPLGPKPHRVMVVLWVNLGLPLLLLAIVGRRIYTLWAALKAGSAGSRLQKRILVLFAMVAISPTIAVSVFSALFFNLGIQTWFNERVERAVNESMAVAEAYLAEHKENIRGDAIAMASDLSHVAELATTNPPEFNRIVETQSTLRLLTETMVFQNNHILAQGRLSFSLAFERVPQTMIDQAARGEVVIMAADADKVRALIKLEGIRDAYLLVGRLIDSKVLGHMQNAEGAVNEYNALKNQLDRLQVIFSVVFVTLALLLLLASIWYGMVFAARLTNPISSLVLAAERVRAGDFTARVEAAGSHDEIGSLARAFNRMTEQLQTQRSELIEANRRLDERRRFSEAILSGVSAGVMALDGHKRITLANPSSIAILQKIDQPVPINSKITDLLPGIEELLTQAETLLGEEAHSTLTITHANKTLNLHVRVTVEQLGECIEGFIVTFDDITPLMAAQRTAAWGDVARRVAHEIKNPLTPIQLAAERIKRKYLKFISEDEESFVKYLDTITKNVGDIGRMVEEFVSFSRMPAPVFASEDVIGIIKKSAFAAQVGNPAIDYISFLPDAPVMMECDERQLRQVMTNLLKNAAEAIETMGEGHQGCITVNAARMAEALTITIDDNGSGFPPEQMEKIMEPYVTTRAKGTGLGLSIVKKIVEDHKGTITVENLPTGGARVTIRV